ncbi:MAG: hypothetical protein HY298_27790 [Verrucomicrobia bacterium]|nr:hypothetical protein [Verrucomicrobiota bacterium]
MELFTNAPADWPVIPVLPRPGDLHFLSLIKPMIPDTEPHDLDFLSLAMATALEDGFKEQNRNVHPVAFQTKLFSEGVLKIPCEIKLGSRKFGVFIFPDVNEEAAAHFAGVQFIYDQLEGEEAIYFASAKLPAVDPVNPLAPFDPFMLVRQENKLPSGPYAMWWPTEDDSRFSDSPARPFIRRAYEALNGIETYVLAALLKGLGKVKDDTRSVVLSDELWAEPITGLEQMPMVISASVEKGIRFHFHPKHATASHRKRFWKVFCEYGESWRTAIQREGGVAEWAQESSALAWWEKVEAFAVQKEREDGSLSLLGAVETEKS